MPVVQVQHIADAEIELYCEFPVLHRPVVFHDKIKFTDRAFPVVNNQVLC